MSQEQYTQLPHGDVDEEVHDEPPKVSFFRRHRTLILAGIAVVILLVVVIGVVIGLLSSSGSAGARAEFEYCNKTANYPVKVSAVEIHPYPIKGGKPAEFKIFATAGNALLKGKVIIKVKYFFFEVDTETKDLCQETSCPVKTGDFVMSHKQNLPSLTPPGSYTLTMTVYGEDGKEELTCISFGFSVGI